MPKTQSQPQISEGNYEIKKVNELNFFDLSGSKAKTKGTSNKMYHAELQVEKDGNKAQIFTMYGPTGSVQKKEWRWFDDVTTAEKEYEKILKSKRKKGYKDIDVAQRSLGSDGAKQITKSVELKNLNKDKSIKEHSLHKETARIISTLMGSTNKFVIQTLKCPLGQLSNDQIDAGRDCLNKAKKIVSKKKLSKKDKQEIENLTNDFYGLIPHNLGSGARGQLKQLLLNSRDKIDKKEYDLDTLLDAKAIGATLVSDSVYDQYMSLDTNFDYINPKDSLFSWLNAMVQETKANNHKHLGKVKLLHAWSIQRKNEQGLFLKRAKQIAPECGKQVIPSQMTKIVKSREDVYDTTLFEKANIIPLFHGTRTQNITGILKKGLLIRPSGVVISGAMYGSSLYFGKSTKSINYTSIKSSYYVNDKDDKAFLFISDCALGKQKIAKGAMNYNEKSIKPFHSVWAKGGYSGVINDEFMLYRTDQHNIRYLLEFTCLKD